MKCSTCGYIEYENAYLMLYRDRKQHDVNHGKWIGVGGKFEHGETARQCMCREIKEETGLVFTEDELCFRGILYFHYSKNEEEKIWIYTVTSYSKDVKECDEGELAWVKKDQILDLPLWEGDSYFLMKMIRDDNAMFTLDLYYDDQGHLLHAKERTAENE